jgi:hypothetical protein
MLTSINIPNYFAGYLPQKKVFDLDDILKVYDRIDADELISAVKNDSGKYTSWNEVKSKI